MRIGKAAAQRVGLIEARKTSGESTRLGNPGNQSYGRPVSRGKTGARLIATDHRSAGRAVTRGGGFKRQFGKSVFRQKVANIRGGNSVVFCFCFP